MKLNELGWTRVEDDLEDIGDGGFYYGLEELSGVSVENDGGTVKFVPSESNEKKPPAQKAIKKKSDSKKKKIQKGAANQEPVQTTFTSKSGEGENRNRAEGVENAVAGSNEKQVEPAGDISETESEGLNEFDVLGKLEDERVLHTLGSWPKNLDPRIYKGLDKLGFLDPTPIQVQTIPAILEGKDVIGKAATGSGKTLAYSLPLIQRFYEAPNNVKDRPEGLIISPTRELAHQIRDHIDAILPSGDQKRAVVTLTGGLAIQKQLRQLAAHPAVVVATPGRLFEVLEQLPAKVQQQWQRIPSLVLDEADRLVQSGSFAELESVLRIIGISKQRQVLVYSATFNTDLWSNLSSTRKRKREEIREIMEQKFGLSKTAAYVDADPESKVAKAVRQAVIDCPNMEKDLYLYYFLLLYPGRTVTFVNSIDAVKRIVPLLKEVGIPAVGVHSDMIQKQRLRSIERFKSNPSGVLIATDVAARGLDVPFVDHVVHYHLPRTGDMYIHRSGRTARAGNEGVSVVLSSPQESSGPLPKLVKLIDSKPQHLDVDFDILEKLRVRIRVAKKIADTQIIATQKGKSQSWVAQAANELGIDVDEDFDASAGGDLRGKRSQKNDDDAPGALQALRAELAYLLKQKLGTNRRYLTSGSENLAHKMIANPNAVVPGKESKTALEELSKKSKKVTKTPPAPSLPASSAATSGPVPANRIETHPRKNKTAASQPLSAVESKKSKARPKPGSVTKTATNKAKKQQVVKQAKKSRSEESRSKQGSVAENYRFNGPKGRGKGKAVSMATTISDV